MSIFFSSAARDSGLTRVARVAGAGGGGGTRTVWGAGVLRSGVSWRAAFWGPRLCHSRPGCASTRAWRVLGHRLLARLCCMERWVCDQPDRETRETSQSGGVGRTPSQGRRSSEVGRSSAAARWDRPATRGWPVEVGQPL